MESCRVVLSHEDTVREMAKEARQTGREQAMSICEDGSLNRSSGSKGSVEVEPCEPELINIHTHPVGNPVRSSRRDISTLLITEEGDKTDMTCVVGPDGPSVRCLELDRSHMTNDEYVELVQDIDKKMRESEEIPYLSNEHPETFDSCEIIL